MSPDHPTLWPAPREPRPDEQVDAGPPEADPHPELPDLATIAATGTEIHFRWLRRGTIV